MNDDESPVFRAALAGAGGAPHLRVVWTAQLLPMKGNLSPWERLHDLLLASGYIEWLRRDVQNEAMETKP